MHISLIDINVVLCLVAFAWHYCLFCGYISDDHAAVAQRKDIIPDEEKKDRGEGFWVKRFNDGILMFYLNRLFWSFGFKDYPFFWHLFCYLVHIMNVYLLYLFLIPVTGYEVALFAAAFWGVNPMLNQNVVWISGRPYLLGVFLTLIAFNCWQYPYVFIPFYVLAVITNISIFFAPIIMLLLHPQEWQSFVYVGSMLAFAVPFLIWKFNKRFTKALVLDRDNFSLRKRKINVFLRMIQYYTYCIFFPVKMGWYHEGGFKYNNAWEKHNYLTFIGFLIICFASYYFPFETAFFVLGFLPNSNIYATNSFLQDRYIYFCSIGVAVAVGKFIAVYPELFYVAMTFYITRTYMYTRHLKNDEMMYRENWRNHPRSDYAINNLSFFLIQQKRYDEARLIIEQGININRSNKMLWYNLGITYAAQGNFNNDEGKFKFIKALDCWKTCLQIEPRWQKPAEDLKKLIKLLVDNKVLTVNQGESTDGMSIVVPEIKGLKEEVSGKNE